MSCKIFRNFDTDNVERVEAVNGEDSQLYKEALRITQDEEEALNIWAYAHTPGFIDTYGDWIKEPAKFNLNDSQEPLLSDVMMGLNLNNQEDLLNLKESVDVHNFISQSGLDVNGLYSTLKRTFFNSDGQFVIDRKKLAATGLYLQEEIGGLMDYPSARAKVLQTINKLRNSLKNEGNAFDKIGPTGVDSEHPLYINTGEQDSLGKMQAIPIEEVENYLKNNIGEYINEENFLNKLGELDREDIREAILNNPASIDYTREIIKNTRTVPVFVSRDGVLVQKNVNDTVELLKNTITVNDDKVFFTATVDELRAVPEANWYSSPKVVLAMLSRMEQIGAKAGIDLSGLQDEYALKSQEEIVGFLDLVDDFNIKTEELTLTDDDIVEFSNDLTEFFQRSVEPEFRAITTVPEFQGKNLIMLEGDINETEVYRTDGLIKAFGNLYQRVDFFNDYNSAMEEVYNALQKDISILPREAFKDFGLNKGYYDLKAISNPLNKNKVIRSINNFVTKKATRLTSDTLEDYDTNREIELMRAIFNEEIPQTKVKNNVANRLQNFSGDYNYLTTDFISDFYLRMLEEKITKKSDLWDTALKHFTVNSKGIDTLTQSPEILSQIKLVLQSEPILYNNLVNYSLISKNDNLNFLQEFSNDAIVDTIDTRRDFVTNNPDSIDILSKDYTKVTDDTVIVRNSTDEFIHLNDGLYELTSSDNGVAIYSRLITGVNPQFYDFGLSYPIVEDVDVKSFRDASPKTFFEDVSGVSQTNLDSKRDDMSCLS